MRLDPVMDLKAPSYTPNRLFQKVAEFVGARNDAELARALNCSQAQLCRMRQRRDPISYRLIVKIMDRTDWSIRKVRELAGMPAPAVREVKPRRSPKALPAKTKVSDAQVLEIRASKKPISLTAELYGISDRYVQLIQQRKARGNVGVVRA